MRLTTGTLGLALSVIGVSAPFAATADEHGLMGHYYNDTMLGQDGGAEVATRLDPLVDFNFVTDPPPGVGRTDTFSAKWVGTLVPRYDENYMLMTGSDDGSRVLINGQVVVDNWYYQPLTYRYGFIQLQAGQSYDIEVDYFQGPGDAQMELWWQSPSQEKEIIPSSQLLAPVVAGPDPVIGTSSPGGTTYYVSSNGSDVRDGTSPDRAWQTVSRVNMETFAPGDQILFERGGTYGGSLQPQGSGSDGAPISIGAYGWGASPVIDGQGQSAAVQLFNQEYWDIDSLEVRGGTKYGVFISGNTANQVWHHIHLTNLSVHDMYADPSQLSWDSGLVVVVPEGPYAHFEDVLVDGVDAFNSNLWYGIHVGFNFWYGNSQWNQNEGVTIRNSIAHDVYGDGITVAQSHNVLIEHDVVYNTGLSPSQSAVAGSYTPNGIWTWQCDTTTVQWNEGYATHSFDYDGGVFDIDFGSVHTVVQNNYAHDADGYCVAILGGNGAVSSDSIVRFNVCSNNGRKPGMGEREGDIFISTFNGGSLDGVQVYNNTAYWNPATDGAWLHSRGIDIGQSPRFVMNNLVYSQYAKLMDSDGSIPIDYNLYWTADGATPTWTYNWVDYHRLDDLRSNTGIEANGVYGDPLLANPTYHDTGWPLDPFVLGAGSPAMYVGSPWSGMGWADIAGHVLPIGGSADIGAVYSEN